MSNFRMLALWLALCGSAGAATSAGTPPAAGSDGNWRTTATPGAAPTASQTASGQAVGASALQSGPLPGQALPLPGQALPPPTSAAYDQAQATISPLTPDEIRQLRAQQTEQNRALATPGTGAAEPERRNRYLLAGG